ncbi:Cd(II)/Pb(II)-responsive transcriptional regulator, partial [Pseudomonas sp. FG-3G]
EDRRTGKNHRLPGRNHSLLRARRLVAGAGPQRWQLSGLHPGSCRAADVHPQLPHPGHDPGRNPQPPGPARQPSGSVRKRQRADRRTHPPRQGAHRRSAGLADTTDRPAPSLWRRAGPGSMRDFAAPGSEWRGGAGGGAFTCGQESWAL